MTLLRPAWVGRAFPSRLGMGDAAEKDFIKQCVRSARKMIGIQANPALANSSTTATNLMACNIPANLIDVEEAISFTAFGTTATNANSKTIAVTFGGTSIFTTTNTGSNKNWRIDGTIVRTGLTTQVAMVNGWSNSAGIDYTNTALTLDMTADQLLQVVGTGGATNDILQQYLAVENVEMWNIISGQ